MTSTDETGDRLLSPAQWQQIENVGRAAAAARGGLPVNGDAALLAPLASAELYVLEQMLYRSFNRLCDEAEWSLREMDSYAPATLQARQLHDRSRLSMAAMLEIQELHTIACRAGIALRKAGR